MNKCAPSKRVAPILFTSTCHIILSLFLVYTPFLTCVACLSVCLQVGVCVCVCVCVFACVRTHTYAVQRPALDVFFSCSSFYLLKQGYLFLNTRLSDLASLAS